MAETSIEWTQRPGTIGATLNPTTGCDKISPGCGLPRFDGDDKGGCYAMAMAKRLKAMGQSKYQNDGDPRTSGPGFGLTMHPDVLPIPLGWKKPRTVFVNSMSDLFHAKVSREFLARWWAVMAATPQHTYQILTKRPERMARIVGDDAFELQVDDAFSALPKRPLSYPWPLDNVWLGASVELDKYVSRADALRATPAAIRFLSAEPLLGPLPSLDLAGIGQIIIGGESGPGARPMDLDWVYDLIEKARASDTAVFVKQLGTRWTGSGKGSDWDRWPADLRIREYPRQPEQVTAA